MGIFDDELGRLPAGRDAGWIDQALVKSPTHALRQMNITASALFPGVDGLGRSIRETARLRLADPSRHSAPPELPPTLAWPTEIARPAEVVAVGAVESPIPDVLGMEFTPSQGEDVPLSDARNDGVVVDGVSPERESGELRET